MLKLNLKQPLRNLAGEEMRDTEDQPVTIGRVMANAIISIGNAEDPTRNYLLASDLYQKEEMVFTAESLEYTKKQIKAAGIGQGNVFPSLYKGQILNILNGLDKQKDEQGKKE